jgi:hypothetical protein
MREESFDGHLSRPVVIDLCASCQSLWFDGHESLNLTPGSTLALFRLIGESAARPQPSSTDIAKCPRCRGRLRLARDMQRNTRFEYLRCPNNHGRLTTFVEFLKEKDFIRPLTTQQVAELRKNVQSVNCSNCGAPVELSKGAACGHCGSALSMLDMNQAEKLVQQLQSADRADRGVDPALPLEMERARRQTEAAFASLAHDATWRHDLSSTTLVAAGLRALARWVTR